MSLLTKVKLLWNPVKRVQNTQLCKIWGLVMARKVRNTMLLVIDGTKSRRVKKLTHILFQRGVPSGVASHPLPDHPQEDEDSSCPHGRQWAGQMVGSHSSGARSHHHGTFYRFPPFMVEGRLEWID